MPRTGRGGRRELPIGSASGNRTDLNQHLPVQEADNQPYGERARQQARQGAIPMAPIQAQTAPPPSPTSTVPLQRTLQQAAPKAGSLPFLDPTNRPDEPVTEGLPFGAGAGPEVMNHAAPVSMHPVGDAFQDIANSPHASPVVSDLADTARLLGL